MNNLLPIRESDIQNAVLELLQRNNYYAWRQNTGAAPFYDKRGVKSWVKFGQPGFADIMAVSPNGTFVALEIKHPARRKTVTAAQEKFLADIKAHNGIASVICSVEEAATLLNIRGLF